MNPGRRTLRFGSLDEVMPDVERLREGYTTVGRWSLAEICGHLAGSIRHAADMPASTQHDPSLRASQEQVDRIFETGMLPEGMPMPDALSSSEPLDEAEAVERLREAIAYYQASPGPRAGHRILGPLTRDQWDRLVCIHCAHHLSFAAPR